MPFTFLVGGARSGKSRAAERLAARSAAEVTFVATAEALDAEMTARIAAHRLARPAGWQTVEEPLDVVGVVAGVGPGDFVVVDCLTLWVSNVMGAGWDDVAALRATDELAALLAARPGGAAVVSNEVGSGIVPIDPSARRFRDLLGAVNARMADRAQRALLMVAGRALVLEELGDG